MPGPLSLFLHASPSSYTDFYAYICPSSMKLLPRIRVMRRHDQHGRDLAFKAPGVRQGGWSTYEIAIGAQSIRPGCYLENNGGDGRLP